MVLEEDPFTLNKFRLMWLNVYLSYKAEKEETAQM